MTRNIHGSHPALAASLARLTENEKDCLRRRLRAQTAKEMAIDLAVSPSAVEKRLKMARAKLGLSSSLEAARLLEAVEKYQGLVPYSSDLASEVKNEPVGGRSEKRPDLARRIPTLATGVITMLLLIIALGVAASVPSGQAVADSRPSSVSELRELATTRVADEPETRSWLRDAFVQMDKNKSGYIEPKEGVMAYDRSDTNHDGKVSPDEWMTVNLPIFLKNGIPLQANKNSD